VTPELEKPYIKRVDKPREHNILALYKWRTHSEIDNGRAHVFKNKKVYRGKEVCFLKNQTIDFCNISMTTTTKI
jgi:hypothetical protein